MRMLEKIQIIAGEFVQPSFLHSTQHNNDPHPERMYPYDHEKDVGITVAIDEYNIIWIRDGHNRVAAALLSGKLVKIGRVENTTSEAMWSLIE